MTTELPVSECFAALADRHRRLTVRTLSELGGPLSLRELAEHVTDCTHERASDDQRQRVHITLYHHHLPRLEDLNVVSVDPDDTRVSRGSNFERLAQYLEPGTGTDGHWTTPNTSGQPSRND